MYPLAATMSSFITFLLSLVVLVAVAAVQGLPGRPRRIRRSILQLLRMLFPPHPAYSSRFRALNIARNDALVMLELTPTPNVVFPVLLSIR